MSKEYSTDLEYLVEIVEPLQEGKFYGTTKDVELIALIALVERLERLVTVLEQIRDKPPPSYT